MQRRIWVLLFSVLVTAFCAFGGTAPTDTFWQIAGAGGSYSYGGGGDALVGSSIEVDAVVDAIDSNPANPVDFTQYTVLGSAGGSADLTFTSGAETSGWNWGSGGTLEIVGCIQDPANKGQCIAGETKSTVLVTDDFTSVGVSVSSGKTGFVFGGLQGTINANAAAFLGIPTTFVSPASQMSTKVTGLPATVGKFSGVTTTTPGGNLDLYYANAVPEGWNFASTLGIFGLALTIFGIGRRVGLIKALAS